MEEKEVSETQTQTQKDAGSFQVINYGVWPAATLECHIKQSKEDQGRVQGAPLRSSACHLGIVASSYAMYLRSREMLAASARSKFS